MSVVFPLYDDLLRQVGKAGPAVDWRQLSATINGLKPERCQIIYALILHHFLLEHNTKLRSWKTARDIPTPYGAKSLDGGKGLIYTLSNLPAPLQQILAEFVLNYE